MRKFGHVCLGLLRIFELFTFGLEYKYRNEARGGGYYDTGYFNGGHVLGGGGGGGGPWGGPGDMFPKGKLKIE